MATTNRQATLNLKVKIDAAELKKLAASLKAPLGNPGGGSLPDSKAAASGKGFLGGLVSDLGLGGFVKALGPAAVAFGAAKIAASAVGNAVHKMAAEIQSLVSIANPGVMKRFNYALQDSKAVIGHALTPVLEIWTKQVRVLGDFLAAILPSAKEVRDILGNFNEPLKIMREVLAEIAPYIKQALISGLKLYAEFLKVFWGGIKKLLDLAKEFGLIQGGGKLPDSTGAAARSAKFSDPEAAAKEFYQAIFSQQGADPARETATNTRGIWDALKDMGDKIGNAIKDKLSEIFSSLPDLLAGAFAGLVGPIFAPLNIGIDALASAFTGLASALTELANFPGALTATFNELPAKIGAAFANLPQQIGEAIKNALPIPSVGSAGGPVATAAAAAVPGVNVVVSAYEAARRWITGE